MYYYLEHNKTLKHKYWMIERRTCARFCMNFFSPFKHAFLLIVVLRGGRSNKEGNVFMLNSKTKLFGPVCDDFWTLKAVSKANI